MGRSSRGRGRSRTAVRASNSLGKKRSRQKMTTLQVCRNFITYSTDNETVVDVSGMFSRRCFETWVRSRREAPLKPEESFRRAITAHIRGTDCRQPFTPSEERAILHRLRGKGAFDQAFAKNDKHIGRVGFRSKGFHESKRESSNDGESQALKRKGNTAISKNKLSGNYTLGNQKDPVTFQTVNQATEQHLEQSKPELGALHSKMGEPVSVVSKTDNSPTKIHPYPAASELADDTYSGHNDSSVPMPYSRHSESTETLGSKELGMDNRSTYSSINSYESAETIDTYEDSSYASNDAISSLDKDTASASGSDDCSWHTPSSPVPDVDDLVIMSDFVQYSQFEDESAKIGPKKATLAITRKEHMSHIEKQVREVLDAADSESFGPSVKGKLAIALLNYFDEEESLKAAIDFAHKWKSMPLFCASNLDRIHFELGQDMRLLRSFILPVNAKFLVGKEIAHDIMCARTKLVVESDETSKRLMKGDSRNLAGRLSRQVSNVYGNYMIEALLPAIFSGKPIFYRQNIYRWDGTPIWQLVLIQYIPPHFHVQWQDVTDTPLMEYVASLPCLDSTTLRLSSR